MSYIIHYEDLNEVNAILRVGMENEDDARWINAGKKVLHFLDYKSEVRSPKTGKKVVEDFIFSFLNKGDYLSAATLLFGTDKFDARPQITQDCFRVIQENARCVLVGASSMGKSYNAAFWLLMDYLADMRYTKVRMGAVNHDHLKSNLFSDMVDAIESSVLDLELDTILTSLEIKPAGMSTANHIIKGVTFPTGDERATGRFKSLKPTRRPSPSKKWGPMGRVRVLLDEASEMSRGPFIDLNSPAASINGPDRVKFVVALNPSDVTHWSGQICEPEEGWDTLDPEIDREWKSKSGWHVLRLDALQSENVKHKREIYPGIQTYEGFLSHLSDGENSAKYWTYGRGFWPLDSNARVIIPMSMVQKRRNDLIFPDGFKACGAVDLAYTKDKIVFTLGRVGKAIGYDGRDNRRHLFRDEAGKAPARTMVQIEQQFEIEPKDFGENKTAQIGEAIIEIAKEMNVSPDYLAVDSTTIGIGIFDYLASKWGPVMGINWQKGATELKFTKESQESPKELYSNIGTEMYFAFKFWLEYGIIHFGQHLNDNPLFKQLTSRQYRSHRGASRKIIVETKEEYRRRGYSGSPDHADSCVMLTQLIRQRYDTLPSQIGDESNEDFGYIDDPEYDPVTSKSDIYAIESLVLEEGEDQENKQYKEVSI